MLASTLRSQIQNDLHIARLNELYRENYDNQKERYIKAIDRFIELYGDLDIVIFSVPGRSEVLGNHTDHQHGQVLAASIDLDIIAVVSKSDHSFIEIVSDEYEIAPIDISDRNIYEEEKETSAALVRGVASKLIENNHPIGGFKAYMTSDVLQGSGLSSSAAFEVMIGTILLGLYDSQNFDAVEIAKVGQYAENVYFGKPCGLMDQCACSVGGLIHIDFKDPTNPLVQPIHINFDQFGCALCITDVHASHADLTQDYADIPLELKAIDDYFKVDTLRDVDEVLFYESFCQLRKVLKNDRALLRALHVFEENRRVEKGVEALQKQDFQQFCQVIVESGNSSYKYLQNIYSAHDFKNQSVSLALALSEKVLKNKGAYRVHGGGFAGTIQAFVPIEKVEEYKAKMDFIFGKGSCHVLRIRPQGGYQVF